MTRIGYVPDDGMEVLVVMRNKHTLEVIKAIHTDGVTITVERDSERDLIGGGLVLEIPTTTTYTMTFHSLQVIDSHAVYLRWLDEGVESLDEGVTPDPWPGQTPSEGEAGANTGVGATEGGSGPETPLVGFGRDCDWIVEDEEDSPGGEERWLCATHLCYDAECACHH